MHPFQSSFLSHDFMSKMFAWGTCKYFKHMKQTIFIKAVSAPLTEMACLYLDSLLMLQSADGQPPHIPLHNSGWGHCRVGGQLAAALTSQGNFLLVYQLSPVFTTDEAVLQRHSNRNHFLVHSTSIIRQMSINTLLTYLVSLRLSLSPWQLSDVV